MGEVYKARDTRLGREIAIKVLPAEFASDPDRLRRFEREARSASALSDPHIVTVYDVGEAAGVHYFACELVEGSSLRHLMDRGAIPVKRILELAEQISSGLAAAHEKGIVHRDLKPENILLTKSGQAKIADFGLAKLAETGDSQASQLPTSDGHNTSAGIVMGTVSYMSPEQARGAVVDFRSDQFSLGTILYEMMTGEKPFRRPTAPQTLSAIIEAEPEPIRATGPENTLLRWMIERLIAKDPEERFSSTKDLARDLKGIRDHVSEAGALSGSGPTPPAPARRWRMRTIAPAAIASVFVLLAMALLTGRAGRNDRLTFRAFTFRRGTIRSARFTPDGHTIVYGAAWEGAPVKLFSASAENLETTPISLPDADILAINAEGEVLICLGRHYLTTHHSIGTLAQAPLSGGAPHEILENVQTADFGPDGKSIAVIRDVEGKNRLEYPIGTVLCESVGWMSHIRVSPAGDLVAFFEHPDRWGNHGTLAVVDRKGRKRVLTSTFNSEEGLTWSPSGKEIWFSAGYGVGGDSVYAVTPNARLRVVYRGLGDLAIFDVAPDGKALLSRAMNQRAMMFGRAGEARERDLSWFDWSYPVDLLASGRAVLFSESGLGAGPKYGVFLRRTDGSPAARIGDGNPLSLSPDGSFAIAKTLTTPTQIVVLPTGAGEPRTFRLGSVEGDQAAWFPDNRRILLEGHEPGRGARLYVATEGGLPRPISEEGVRINGSNPVSADGRFVTATGRDGRSYVYPVEGGTPRAIAGLSDDDEISRWTPDGTSLYVFRHGELPARIMRLNLESGRRELWKEVLPGDPSGVVTITPILLTPDGETYVYSYPRILSQLFLAEGLK